MGLSGEIPEFHFRALYTKKTHGTVNLFPCRNST